MKVLLLSAYHAKSHQQWCEGMMSNIPAQWTLLTLPARYFSWRIRSNSLTWSFSNKAILQKPYDLIIATSMTDLNSIIGFNPELARIPSILYFHENQFAYPLNKNVRENIEPMLVPIYSALTADTLCFNTHYNYETFIDGVGKLLRRFPDNVPKRLVEKLELKASILPVPINDDCYKVNTIPSNKRFSIVWNHRWEYDKWPACFFKAMEILKNKNVSFDLYILGEQFEKSSAVFNDAKVLFAQQIRQWGRVEKKSAYYQMLKQAQIVVSTALHDFQGLSIMEGVAAGCIPVVPDRLSYQELFEEKYRYTSIIDDLEKQAISLASHILTLISDFQKNQLEDPPKVDEYSWRIQKEKYNQLINEVIKRQWNK